MIDLNTDKVILAKPIRRKTFILGKSTALLCKHIAAMDDGTVRVVTERCPEHFAGVSPLFVCIVWRRSNDADSFEEACQSVREFEARFITEELPETC